MGMATASQTPTAPGQLPLQGHQRRVPGGAAPISVAGTAPALALSGPAAATTGTTCTPYQAQPPQTPRPADRTLRSVGYSSPGIGSSLQRQMSRLSAASQGSPKLSVAARACSAPVEFGRVPAGSDGEFQASDCSRSCPLPASPRPNAPPLSWSSRGHAAESAKAARSDMAVWIPPSSPLRLRPQKFMVKVCVASSASSSMTDALAMTRTVVPLGARLMEADRGTAGSFHDNQDMPSAASVPMTKLYSQPSLVVCKQDKSCSPRSSRRKLHQLSCETADPYAGIQLTPLNDRPFQTLASIARRAQASLMERLSPLGPEHLTEHPASF